MKKNTLLAVALSSCVLFFAGCGGSDESAAVRYEGSTLIVDNVRYERSADVVACPREANAVCPASRGIYEQGEIYVSIGYPGRTSDTVKENQVESEFARLGLTVKQKSADPFSHSTSWIVGVPPLSEEQWVSALKRNPLYSSVGVIERGVTATAL